MSLTGNLEDLPLLDIIQIVSFSKKTGYLTITTSSGSGAIVFREGFVVSSFTPTDPPLPSDMPAEKRDGIIRRRIEMALQQLVRLREGQFGFSLAAELPEVIDGRNVSQEILDPGINPQELLLDLARGIDEDRRDSSAALEASFAEPGDEPEGAAAGGEAMVGDELAGLTDEASEPEPPPAEAEPLRAPPPPEPASPEAPAVEEPPIDTVLLVEDEADLRALLARRFADAGYTVVDAGTPNAAVREAKKLGQAGTRFMLVTDLGMPTSGGSSFQGGFEVIKRVGKMHLEPPTLMMTDTVSPSVRGRARQLKVRGFVFKPGLSRLDPEQFEADMEAFAAKLVKDVLPRLARPRPLAASAPEAEATAPGGATAAPAAAPASEDSAREMRILQERLGELRGVEDASQISQLIMRMARDFFERGILFLVKDETLRGLGGFGPGPKDESLNLLVRDIAIPLNEKSVFQDVVSSHRAFCGPLPEERWTAHLVGRIGRFRSTQAVLLPLLTHRETMAVLFVDNPDTDRPPGRTDVLEVFLTQAGVSLENAFLQRKLRSMQEPAVSG